MENCIVNRKNYDFLSQSYSQGIERITGTKDNISNFKIPEEVLEIRERTWDDLFDKYSKEMSDDIELNVDTLEPEEEEREKAISEEEYSCGQRVPMRKPATLVQYWINTGNPPYKVLLDENEFSETGSSLSERETTHLLASSVKNAINAVNTVDTDDKQKCKNDSSCSSVDTAAYILSNANVTKKADTIAIIEGARCIEIKSLKDVSIEDTRVPSNDKIESAENTELSRYPVSRTEYATSEICDGTVPANAAQSSIYLQNLLSCEEMDKIDGSNANQRNLDVQTIDDIASIFRQFDKASKRLVESDKNNDVSDRGKEMDTFREKQALQENIACEFIAKDTNLTAFHRKKLYTGRDSPVDLILSETHGTSRLSGARQSLHPALDPDGTIKRKTFLVHKSKSKHSLSAKRSLDSKKVKRKEGKESSCTSSKIITDVNNERTTNTNDDKILDSANIDSSFKGSSDLHDNSDGQRNDIRECDDTNVSVKNNNYKRNLAFLNLKPIVLLERIKPLVKQHDFKSGENTYVAEEKNVYNDGRLNKFKKLSSCEIENLEVETIDSDDSTILICQCNMNASQRTSSLSDCSLDLRLSIEDDLSASNAERKDNELSNSNDTDTSQNKLRIADVLPRSLTSGYANAAMQKSQVSNKHNVTWQDVLSNKSKTLSHLKNKRSKTDNVKLREIKVVLERLPLLSAKKNCTSTMMEMQALNRNDAAWQKEISNKSKAHFSNPYERNKKDNGKLGEIRVVLKRLPANVCFKEVSNVTNTNIFSNERKILQNTNLQAKHNRESQIGKSTKILGNVRNNYSSRMNTKSKKNNNDKIDGKFNIIVESGSKVLDKTESDSTFQQKTFQHKNCNEAIQDVCQSKYSILTFTSDEDEDDFVRSIQHPRKRSKVSIDDNVSGESNISEKNFCDRTKLIIIDKNKDSSSSSRNLSGVTRSSKKIMQRDIESMKKKKECSKVVEMKSFDNTPMTTNSLRTRKNERFVFFSSKDDNISDSNSDKCKIRISFLDSKKNKINNNSKKYSNGVMKKKNEIDRKDVHVTFLQTRTFDANSSEDSKDSEEDNSYISSIHKTLRNSSTRDRLRYHDPGEINTSIAKRYDKKRLNSLNFSLQKHNRIYDVKTKSRSIDKGAVANERLANEESNGDIVKSRISDARKDASSSSPVSDVRNTCKMQHVQEEIFSNTFPEETNLDWSLRENKEISGKSKNSLTTLQGETYVAVRKGLTFQTKSYYDSSDSSETL